MIINLSSPLFTVHLITLRVLNLFQLRTAALLLFYYIFYQPVDPVKHNPYRWSLSTQMVATYGREPILIPDDSDMVHYYNNNCAHIKNQPHAKCVAGIQLGTIG